MSDENAMVPMMVRGTLSALGQKPGARVVSFEKHPLLLLNKESGRYLVGLYMGPRIMEVKKYANVQNPSGKTIFEEFSVIETNSPSAGGEPIAKGELVSVMGGGQLSKDLRVNNCAGRFMHVEFLGKQSGQLKDGTFVPAMNRYRVVDIDTEMRRQGFGSVDADTVDVPPEPEVDGE